MGKNREWKGAGEVGGKYEGGKRWSRERSWQSGGEGRVPEDDPPLQTPNRSKETLHRTYVRTLSYLSILYTSCRE